MKNLLIVSAALLLPLTGIAAPQGLEDVAKVTKRDDGLYNVECTYGGVEEGVTLANLKAGKVCQLNEMRSKVAFKKFDTSGFCYITNFDHAAGITGTSINMVGLAIDNKNMFANCNMEIFYSIPAGYQIGLKKSAVTFNLNEYDGDAVSVVLNVGEEGSSHAQTAIVSKQGESSHDLEFLEYVFTGCSTGMDKPQRLKFEMMVAPSQGAINSGTAALTSLSYKDTAIRPCQG